MGRKERGLRYGLLLLETQELRFNTLHYNTLAEKSSGARTKPLTDGNTRTVAGLLREKTTVATNETVKDKARTTPRITTVTRGGFETKLTNLFGFRKKILRVISVVFGFGNTA